MWRRCAIYGPLTTWAVVMCMLTGCQSAPAESVSVLEPTALPSATPPPDPRAAAEEAVLASYRGMWREFVSAAATADWKARGLGRHATGDALNILRHGLWLARQREQVIGGEPVLSPEVASLRPGAGPTRAKVIDCVDDTGFLVRTRSGERVSGGAPTGRHRTTAGLVLRGGSWYVRSFVLKEAGTC
ncbi:hypothetical protein Ppa06_36360 [Planomonospora parontospora subsp. parontospora]|uniref:Secreted protein n=2 Tax=Planomonospora parontospora TaxID=58119 RepID=A0AA37BH52_9ACTN|nr:hypothetical protein [Planomonospora parontospora]GGK70272.1 hypothetical protein GCM10010126_32080 [Planomonospora parontospora]GII09838.1 hypothetical protein Ppa06_36360 [Planomonospora parontospora subsp. parontospora]